MSLGPRPALMLYVGDWLRNSKLRRCSVAARGAWIDVMCLMHDSDEYGVLRWPLAEIAHASGLPLKLLRELAAKDVIKGGDAHFEPFTFAPRHAGQAGPEVVLVTPDGGPCWYSSRMVRDEWVRQRRGASSRFEPSPNSQPKPEPMPPIGGGIGDGPSVAVAVASKSKPSRRIRAGANGLPYPEDFETLWAAYPRRDGGNSKRDAWAQYSARLRQGVAPEELMAGVIRYAAFVRADGSEGTRYVKQASTFLGRGEHFREAWTPKPNGHDPAPPPRLNRGAMV